MRTSPGLSGSLPATGWSSSSPKCRANATCSARVMSWSRKNRTLCFSSSARISATRPGSREATPRFTFESSAPIVHVSGSTLMESRVMIVDELFSSVVACAISFSGVLIRLRLDHEDSRARRLSRFQVAVGLRRIRKLVALVDLDPDAPRGDVVEKLAGERIFLGGGGGVVGERRRGARQRGLDFSLCGV